jgi:exodeoxyribonuclease-3
MPKIISYNVNGIRAALRKGLDEWLKAVDADIVCLQEIKAKEEQIDTAVFTGLGYDCFWYPAQKPGYSGTAILSRLKPDKVVYGCGLEAYDYEGRIIRADYGDLSVISVYMPSGSSGDLRQDFKMQFLADFQAYIDQLRQERPKLIISGDYNICHEAIDIHNPQRNQKTSGFLPEERAWVTDFIASGFVDTFRLFNQDPHHYSWWSYRANARAKNLGWRIDYHMATQNLEGQLKRAAILPEAKHSDHCPILLELDF